MPCFDRVFHSLMLLMFNFLIASWIFSPKSVSKNLWSIIIHRNILWDDTVYIVFKHFFYRDRPSCAWIKSTTLTTTVSKICRYLSNTIAMLYSNLIFHNLFLFTHAWSSRFRYFLYQYYLTLKKSHHPVTSPSHLCFLAGNSLPNH